MYNVNSQSVSINTTENTIETQNNNDFCNCKF